MNRGMHSSKERSYVGNLSSGRLTLREMRAFVMLLVINQSYLSALLVMSVSNPSSRRTWACLLLSGYTCWLESVPGLSVGSWAMGSSGWQRWHPFPAHHLSCRRYVLPFVHQCLVAPAHHPSILRFGKGHPSSNPVSTLFDQSAPTCARKR